MAERNPAIDAGTPTKSGQDSRYLVVKADIVDALKRLRDQRATLTLRIDGDASAYECRVLDVLDDALLLEDLRPHTIMRQVAEASNFSLTSRSGGTFVFIDKARVAAVNAERGVPYLRVPLPPRVLFQQRRHNARFALPMRVAAHGAFLELSGRHTKDEQTARGRLIDISAGGCRVEFDSGAAPELTQGLVFRRCVITIPKVLEVAAEAAVRHYHVAKKTGAIVCGLELTDMSVTDRRRLERFIQVISRVAEPR